MPEWINKLLIKWVHLVVAHVIKAVVENHLLLVAIDSHSCAVMSAGIVPMGDYKSTN